jgi:hypothetical protein
LDLRGWLFPEHPVTADDPMMVGAATVFVVTDIAKSTEHYRDVPGFTVIRIAGSLDWASLDPADLCIPADTTAAAGVSERTEQRTE